LLLELLRDLLLAMDVGIAGTAMAARLSDADGAGFALAHHVFGTRFLLLRIIGAGAGVVLTQALGAGRRDEADRMVRAPLGASTWAGLVVALPALLASGALEHRRRGHARAQLAQRQRGQARQQREPAARHRASPHLRA
jgi:hypothetical protein